MITFSVQLDSTNDITCHRIDIVIALFFGLAVINFWPNSQTAAWMRHLNAHVTPNWWWGWFGGKIGSKSRSNRNSSSTINVMTLSNGNIFRVRGPFWGESTDHRWFPLQRACDAGLWCFLRCTLEQTVEQTFETLVILRRHCANYDVTVMLCW